MTDSWIRAQTGREGGREAGRQGGREDRVNERKERRRQQMEALALPHLVKYND